MKAQTRASGGAIGRYDIQGTSKPLQLGRPVALPELRRHKRAFLKLATQNNWIRLREAADARELFAEYLHDNLGTDQTL